MSASITSYIVQIIYIASAWILYPLHFSLLPLTYEIYTFFVKLWFMLLSFVQTQALFSCGFDILFNVFQNPIYILINI